jgi:uncharacterized protein
MTTRSNALVATARPVRFGKALAGHLGRKNTAEWSDADQRGFVLFEMGRGDIWCAPDGLHLEVTGEAESLDRLEDVMGRHLVRFGEKSDESLHVAWLRENGQRGTEQHWTAGE